MRTISEDNKSTAMTLYIIGNGFDLAHNIKSSYADFFNQYNGEFAEYFDSNDKIKYWKDLENALGRIKAKNVVEICNEGIEFDLDYSLSSSALLEDKPGDNFESDVEKFLTDFAEWVRKIDIYEEYGIDMEDDELLYNLRKGALYFTFNYTETLEEIYKIPTSQICHIHGFRCNPKDEIVIGHNNAKEPIESDEIKDDDPNYIYSSKKNVISIRNKMQKQYDSNMNKNWDFFERLGKVGKVVVYGHSLDEVDWPYFKKMFEIIGPKVPWHIYDHEGENESNIKKFIEYFKPNIVNRIVYNIITYKTN